MAVGVRVLGDVRAVAADGSPLDTGGPRQLATLAALAAAHGRVVPADVLADRVWDGAPPASATTTLQGYVARLRRLLEPGVAAREARVLVTRGDGYALQLEPSRLDACVFEELLDRARVEPEPEQAERLLTQALGLWEGRAYGSVADLAALRPEASRLDELRLHAVEQLAAARLAAGRGPELVPELRRLADEHPLREQPQAMLAQALYRAGRQADALAVLRRVRERLVDELGVDPSPQLQAVEAAVLRQDPALLATQTRRPADAHATHELVGREAELAVLERAWASACSGRSTAALITGEPGIGKSWLVDALGARVASAVRWGRFRQAAGAPPYWAWQQVLGGLPSEVGLSDSTGSAAERARFLVGLAVADQLRGLAAERPLLVALDDLQWADGDSLHVLEVVLAELADAPVLLVLTCRSEALHDPRVSGVLAAVTRRSGTARIALRGLDAAAVGALVEARTGVRPSAQETQRLVERTGGNPFFLGEVAALGQDVEALPDSIRDVVRMHVRTLPEGGFDVVAVAALAGRDLAVGLAAQALRRSPVDLDAAVEAAVLSGLLRESAPGRLRFGHDLVREAVLAELSPARRAALQGGLADALETSAVTNAAWAAVARSEAAAGAPDGRAAAACLRAAREALRCAAVEDAAALSARGLTHVTVREHAAELWHVRGVACRRAGLAEESLHAFEQEATIARDRANWPRLAAAALASLPGGVGGWSAVMGPLATPDTLLVEAHAHLEALAPTDASAVLAALAVKRSVTGADGSEALAEAAIHLAGDDPAARARAEIARFIATWSPDRAAQRLQAVEELVTDVAGEPVLEASVLHLLRCALLENGHVHRVEPVTRRFRQIAQAERDEDLLLLDTWWQAGLHQMRGEHTQAQELATQAASRAGSASAAAVDTVSRDTIVAIAAWQQGALLQALPSDAALRQVDPDPDPDLLLVRALAHAEAGHEQEARRTIARIGSPRVGGLRGTVRTILLSEACVAIGATDLLVELMPILESYGDGIVVLWPGTVNHGPAALYRGAAAQALGRHDQAEVDLRAAVELAERVGAVPYADRARARLAGRPPWTTA